jgi:hypothetical protein
MSQTLQVLELNVNVFAEFLHAVWLIDVDTNRWSAVDTHGKVPVRIFFSCDYTL